jgi:hypothetical protein
VSALRYLVVLLLGMVVVGVATAQKAQVGSDVGGTDSSVVVAYSLLDAHLTLHQPVILIFSLTNHTSNPVQLDLGQDSRQGFSFAVVDTAGKRLQLPELVRNGFSALGTVSVQPGHTYSQRLVLNQWYPFPVPGKYEFEGHLTHPLVLGKGAERQIDQGFHLALEIAPRDEAVLSKTCDELVKEIKVAYEQNATDAALALSYVNDTIAVPYLISVLSSRRHLEPIIIQGLGRIGGPSSIDALIEVYRSNDVEMKGLAGVALFDICQQTSDSSVREEINGVLGRT